MCCKLCRWLALTKQVVCKDPSAQAETSWQLMTWELVQAGNRASKTGRCLQWSENKSEQVAVSSDQQNLHNSTLLFSMTSAGGRFRLLKARRVPLFKHIIICLRGL